MIIIDGYIVAVEKKDINYQDLLELIRNKPADPDGYQYKLRDTDLQWELVELPPEPEPDADAQEILDILLGGEGE